MSWKSHHRRAEVLRDVVRTADDRLDGRLPMDVPGVRETFGDELSLLGTLQLRWYTRLTGRIEQELADEPLDLEDAVVQAWTATARALPGTRAVLDGAHAPASPNAEALTTARRKEREMLALMAGRASSQGEPAARIGAQIESLARARLAADAAQPRCRGPAPSLVGRLRSVLAA